MELFDEIIEEALIRSRMHEEEEFMEAIMRDEAEWKLVTKEINIYYKVDLEKGINNNWIIDYKGEDYLRQGYIPDNLAGITINNWKGIKEYYNRMHKDREWPEGIEYIVYNEFIRYNRVPNNIVRKGNKIGIYLGNAWQNRIFPTIKHSEDNYPAIKVFNKMKRIYFAKKISKGLRNQHVKLEILNELHREYTGLWMPLEVRRLIVKNMY